MKHPSEVYLRLLHGRDTVEEDVEQFGYEGPIIGPVNLSWCYGSIRLFRPGWGGGFQFLPEVDDMVAYEGKYYGDFDIITADDEAFVKAFVKAGTLAVAHDYDRFEKLLEHWAGHVAEARNVAAASKRMARND
jgi:hypothetical protein